MAVYSRSSDGHIVKLGKNARRAAKAKAAAGLKGRTIINPSAAELDAQRASNRAERGITTPTVPSSAAQGIGSSNPIRLPGEGIEDFTKRLDAPSISQEQYQWNAQELALGGQAGLEAYKSRIAKLQAGMSGATTTSPQGQTGAYTPASPAVGTSTALRMKERAKSLKEAFGLGNAPVMPDLFGSQDQKSLNLARRERDTINKEMEGILADRLAIDAEFRKFKQNAGEGTTEAGRAGITSEEGRKVQEQYDALNRRELVLETKLSNRNAVISELMRNQEQDYANAVTQYNTQFSQALQLYNLFDKEDDELQANAKANLEVLSNSIQAQIEAGTLAPDQITSVQRSQLQELEVQAGLPIGSTLAVLQTLKPGEEKLYAGVDDFGGFSYITKNAKGEIKVYKSANAVPQDTSDTDDEDSKIVAKFNADLATPNLLKVAGTREQFIRQLQAKYPEIDPSDIATAVYSTYPDGYEKMFQGDRSL